MNSHSDSHQRLRRRFLLAAAGSLVAGAAAMHPARAAVPGRAIVGFQLPPDNRLFLSELLGEINQRYQPDLGSKPIPIPGGAGAVAIETVVASPRDGATVLIVPSTVLTLAPLVRTTPVDPVEILLPVAGICATCLGFTVGPAVPSQVATMADYIRWVRANPASNTYGVPGLGTATSYVGAEVSRLAQLPLRVVGYKGILPLVEDISAGTIPAGITPLPGVADLQRFPRLRLLGMTGDRRVAYLPDVATLQEAGFAEFAPTESLGIYLPKGTPVEKVQELTAAVRAATTSRSFVESITKLGMSPMTSTTADYAVTLAEERAVWKTLVARHDMDRS